MKKWEYNVWEIKDFGHNSDKSKYYLFDYQDKLNELGSQGFEYAGNIETEQGQFMIFKREKE